MDNVEVITAPDIVQSIKRVVASSLAEQADQKTPYYPNAQKMMRNRDILATVLWDIAINGEAFLADGTQLKPESYTDWLATVKYLVSHLDGPVGSEDGLGTNVFKVYVGVNVDNI